MRTPTLAEWLLLPDGERHAIRSKWSGYAGAGEELVSEIVADFRAKYGSLGIEVSGPGVHHGGDWTIDVTHPFIFDRRALPSEYLGVFVHCTLNPVDIPEGFRTKLGYDLPPHRLEAYVVQHETEVRAKLNRPNMTRNEMLSALVGMEFAEFVDLYRSWVRKGLREPFE